MNKNAIHSIFSTIALKYDLLNGLLSGFLDAYWRRKVKNFSGLNPNEKVLDVCTGTGKLANQLLFKMKFKGIVIGVDFCSAMLNIGKNKLSKEIIFIKAEAAYLPFKDNVFDCVTIGFGLRNTKNYLNTLKEMLRVVKEKKPIICLEFSKPHSKILNWIYFFYLKKILPVIGGIISKNYQAYKYLASSIENFISPNKLSLLMKNIGLKKVEYYHLSSGIVTIYRGYKKCYF